MPHIAEVAVPYAILVLQDTNLPITEENLSKVLDAANIYVEPIWLSVFSRALDAQGVKSLLNSFDAGSAAAAPVAVAAATSAAPAVVAESKSSKKEEPEEEEDMALGLFD